MAPSFSFPFPSATAGLYTVSSMKEQSHHLIYGFLTDYLTGEQLVDTDDERIRQQLARFLVEEKGYAKSDLVARRKIDTLFAGQFVTSRVDFTIRIKAHSLLIIRYGPGSLVSRERPAIAAARVLEKDYQIPLAVVSNGRDAELLDTLSGKVLAQGMTAAIPDKNEAIRLEKSLNFKPLTDPERRQRESRILNAFDVEVCCAGQPCALPGVPEG